jgi:hypothetical protein
LRERAKREEVPNTDQSAQLKEQSRGSMVSELYYRKAGRKREERETERETERED